jgi:hypothetical protein
MLLLGERLVLLRSEYGAQRQKWDADVLLTKSVWSLYCIIHFTSLCFEWIKGFW